MKLRWGRHPSTNPSTLHAIDVDKRDGNNFALCAGVLLDPDATEIDVAFGESRKGKCPKCFKVSRERMQKEKRARAKA